MPWFLHIILANFLIEGNLKEMNVIVERWDHMLAASQTVDIVTRTQDNVQDQRLFANNNNF